MAKTINRTVITKVYRAKVIDGETEQIRTFDIECPDMNEAQVIKKIKANLSECEVLVHKDLVCEKKVTYTMPASKFYSEATVKD